MAQAIRSPHGPTMLYRTGHTEKLHGVWVDYTIVDHTEVDDAVAGGWHRTPAEAKEAADRERADAEAAEAAKKEPKKEPKKTPEAPADKPTAE